MTNVWYVKNILANCDGNLYLPILHLPRVELHCKLREKLHRVTVFRVTMLANILMVKQYNDFVVLQSMLASFQSVNMSLFQLEIILM